jgi:type III restriction enzyme
LNSKEFRALWEKINAKSVYLVDFEEGELINKAIAALNRELSVTKIFFKIESGALQEIESKEHLVNGTAMIRKESDSYLVETATNTSVKYDLIGKIVTETKLTRKTVVQIMCGVEEAVFSQFANNPEEFIIRSATIINEQKATVIVEHITYDKLDSLYDTTIFTEPTMKGQLGVNAMAANKHLYDHILYDSENERDFAEHIDTSKEVAVYVKLPNGFFINTPVGKYNPDWAIAFHEGKIKHIYFVAETKGSMSTMQLRMVEQAKIHCAREHFKAISSDSVVYDVVDSYAALLDKVMR